MKVTKFKKIAMALGSLAIIGASSQALAAPGVFTISPSVLGGPATPVQADFISGTSSELVTVTGGTFSASGYLQGTGFSLNSNAIFGNKTGLGSNYGLYLTFFLSGAGGTTPGSTDALGVLNFTVYADKNLDTTFQQATVSGNSFTQAAVTGTTTDDVVVGFGSLIPGQGIAGFDFLGGAFVNATTTFDLCSGAGTAKLGATTVAAAQCTSNVGTSYFSAPVPFFQMAFNEFNNTLGGVSRTTDGQHIAIRSATGGVDFTQVPEPDTLALVGIAALGLGLGSLRKRGTKSA